MLIISLAKVYGQRRFKEARATLRMTFIRVDLSGCNVTGCISSCSFAAQAPDEAYCT